MSAGAEMAAKYLAALGEPIPLSVALCDDYSALLRGEHGPQLELEELLALAKKRGRVLLSGRGGAGKSTILRRLTVLAEEAGKSATLIDLSRWDHDASQAWKLCSDSAREAIDFLLRTFGTNQTDITDLDLLSAQQEKLLIVDGLNETPGSIADDILSACDQAASLLINCSIIVSDRLVRRRTNGDERWYFVMPLGVNIDEARKLLDVDALPVGAQRLLDSPYFVDKGLKGELKESPLATIRDFVTTRGKLDAEGLGIAAQGAFAAYQEEKSRSFDPAQFPGDAGTRTLGTLIEGGVLVSLPGGKVAFNHHWIHDYLAAKHVASNERLWSFELRHASLDSLTFKANSFDAVAFALEELQDKAKNEFLRAVYDWNPYAAGYALAEVEEIAPTTISHSLRTIIIAMLAEKKFDRHYLSARRALDALQLFSDKQATELRDAVNHEEMIAIVAAESEHSDLFSRWQSMFTIPTGTAASDDTVKTLEEDDSIIGWSAANVLKRLSLSEAQIGRIVEIAHHERPVIRWRACHVMGSATEEVFRKALLDRLVNDHDENVRYGAIRSLVEFSSHSEDLAIRLVDDLEKLIDTVAKSPRVLSELTRAVFLSKGRAPNNWSMEISRLFYARADLATETTEMEAWSKLTSDLRQHDRLTA